MLVAAFTLSLTSCGDNAKKEPAESQEATEKVAQKTYKMTTQIPENVITPDVVETSMGTLKFNDGFPTEETAQKGMGQS